MQGTGYWLRTSKFQIEPSEDSETNPHLYGKQFANWLSDKLSAIGYQTSVIPEDWGWCIMCASQPFSLWIGCGSIFEDEEPENEKDIVPEKHITWHCFPVAELSFLKKLFQKNKAMYALTKLENEVGQILVAETEINLVNEEYEA